MSDISGKNLSRQGYIYNTFGNVKYLKYAIASATTLRRYDQERPVTLVCDEKNRNILDENNLSNLFSNIITLPENHASITGFKHNVYKFMPYEENLFLDSDIVWCKNPDSLWDSFSPYKFTITGNQIADLFFGGPKGLSIIGDLILRKRKRTLKQFNITYLSRVQSGMIYATDPELTKQVCNLADEILDQKNLTHFRSRIEEKGRDQESCEWSLAMAMAKMKLQVHPWLNGYESPQLDFMEDYTTYDKDFNQVDCLVYNDRFVYDLKAMRPKWLRKVFISIISLMPGKGDYLYATPYCLHFGWYHQKEPFKKFSERVWKQLTS